MPYIEEHLRADGKNKTDRTCLRIIRTLLARVRLFQTIKGTAVISVVVVMYASVSIR
jgi:hypothetical protein